MARRAPRRRARRGPRSSPRPRRRLDGRRSRPGHRPRPRARAPASAARSARATTSSRSRSSTAIIDDEPRPRSACARGQVTVLIHSGSRGLGHQVCDDYLARDGRARSNATASSSPTASSPARRSTSPEGRATSARWRRPRTSPGATASASRTAPRGLRRGPRRRRGDGHALVYDVAHNIAKFEAARRARRVCVHRKGATRARLPSPAAQPRRSSSPGRMGTAS